MSMDMAGDIEGINRFLAAIDFREKPAGRTIIGIPVLSEDVESVLGKDGITVGSVLSMRDMDAHIFTRNILIFKMTDLANPKAGRVHERDHGLFFESGKS